MMRVRRLDLTRFGHFTDRNLDLGAAVPSNADFHIIYGPNESGKSTLMDAYLRLIYGFPVRGEVYGFKHPLATLQVGGLIEINGTATEMVRVKKAANSLQNKHGDAIPETILQACLGGIVQDDYRKLFCLDDATIEAGGEDITNSKGDIGRLLFAAAAGMSDLSGVLDQVASRAESFYKKNASKTTFAGLKRRLDELAGEIKTLDTSASTYRGLHAALDSAKSAEHKARGAKEELERRKSQLAALIAAHPIAVDLRTAKDTLEPTSNYPITLDIDPEALVAMMTSRVALEFERDRQIRVIADAEAGLEALVLRPDIIAIKDDILKLDQMRGRMEGALSDLPTRISEHSAAFAGMSAKIVELGLNPGDDPTLFVLPEQKLLALERALGKWNSAEATLTSAIEEEGKAQLAHQDSAADLANAKAAATIGPEVDEVLLRFDAQKCVGDNLVALQRIEDAKEKAAQCLRELSLGGVSFVSLPPVSLTVHQADKLIEDLLTADQKIETFRIASSASSEKLAKAQARKTVLGTSADLMTDDVAHVSRAERNALWTTHRAALDAATADNFETAMQRDDRTTTLRQAQADKIADYQQACIAVSETEPEYVAAERRLKDAIEARSNLEAARARHLTAIGLPDISASDLANWMRHYVATRGASDDLQSMQETTVDVRRSADMFRQALGSLPGMKATDDLGSLFRIAQAKASERGLQQAELKLKTEAHAEQSRSLTARQTTLSETRSKRDEAETDWGSVADSALPAGAAMSNLHDALPGFRSLRETNQTIEGLTRQINGMNRDRDAFVAEMAPLVKVMNAPANQQPLDTLRAAEAALAEADGAAKTWKELTDTIVQAKKDLAAAHSSIATQDMQRRKLAEVFDPVIKTTTLEDLRKAVALGKNAIELRAAIARHSAALIARLGVSTRAEAEALLAAKPLDIAEAELETLTVEKTGLTKVFEESIEKRSMAQAALDRVQGDADVAERVARQRTIELDMQEGTLRYLEDRFGFMLAERAIRRYRDIHRGSMLIATEAAFRTLTNDAYTKLSTQTDGPSEVLIAVQSSGGNAKQASEMSKGTKFQLYLALRAAAYEQMAASGTVLPFFCDDIFETFDEARTKAACGLMRQIGQRGQAIYLTHHKHVVEIAQQLCGDDVKVHELVA